MRSVLLAACLPAIAAPGLRGEEAGITLSEALDLAGAQNPGLQALKARQEAEAARTFETRRSNWPSQEGLVPAVAS